MDMDDDISSEMFDLPTSVNNRRSVRVRAMAKGKQTVPLCLGLCFSCCAIMVLAAVGLAILLRMEEEPLIDSQVQQRMMIKNGSALYNQLQKPGLPLWKSFHFYNLTNPVEWAAGKELPKIEELGPYSFKEERRKYIVSLEEDKLVYHQTKYFYWDGNSSSPNVTAEDKICTINIPMVAAMAQTEHDTLKRVLLKDVVFLTSKAKLYICHPAKDLAWNYTDSLVKELHTFKQYPRTYVNIQVNGSINDTQHSVINTGAKDITKLGEIIQWDGHHLYLDTWKGGESNPANKLRGTEGLFFRPLLKEGDTLTAFIDDVQRTFDLKNTEKVKHLNTEALRFRVLNSTFQNATVNPYNANYGSFCPSGLIYLGPTQYPEIPVFGSKPHYLDGDPALRNCCVGMTPPNRDLHDITLDVEPTTGANIQVKQILQINVQVQRSTYFSETKNLLGYNFNNSNTLYFPVLWLNEHAELTPEFEKYLKDQGLGEVEIVREAVPILFWILIGLAGAFAVISLFSVMGYVVRARRMQKSADEEREPLFTTPRT